jgi:hypothetical protein
VGTGWQADNATAAMTDKTTGWRTRHSRF